MADWVERANRTLNKALKAGAAPFAVERYRELLPKRKKRKRKGIK